jgi:acetate kinase
VRKAVCEQLGFLGVEFDEQLNSEGPKERIVTRDGSRVIIGVIPTNEELVIALDTMHIVKGELPPSMKNMVKNRALEPLS